jgi:type I restriction enzyme R subunit
LTAQHQEAAFETELCVYLEARGWRYSRNDEAYDKQRALVPEDLLGWLEDTQPDTYGSIVKPSMSATEKRAAQGRFSTVL